MDVGSPLETIKKLGPTLADVLDPGHDKNALSITPLKTSATATTFRIELARKSAVAKIFSEHKKKNDPFGRERWALDVLHSEFVAKLLFVSVPDRLIMTEFVDGKTLSEILHTHNLLRNAEHMGQWFGRLANIAPRKSTDDNWQAYLEKYDSGFNAEALQGADIILRNIPITRVTVAHNDNALSNFILGTDKKLYGIDFETSRFKPEGWDLITAARFVFRKSPDHLDIIADGMLRGYQMTVEDSTLPEYFDAVIKAVAVANIVFDATN